MSDLLRLKHLEHVADYEEGDKLIIKVRSRNPVPERQCCLFATMIKNGRKLGQRYRDEPIRRQTVRIEIDRQRYKCSACGKTGIYEALPDIDIRHDMTKKLLVRIQKDAVEWPFSHAAKINGVEAKQVERIFQDHADKVLKGYLPKLPRVLSMDEKVIRKKARFIIGDIENSAMLDMQMSRKKLDLNEYFALLPGRDDVEVICQDMWTTYRELNKGLFKNATVVIDKYHVQRTANKGVEAVRRLFQQDVSKAERIHLKNKQSVFLARWGTAKPRTINQLNALFTYFPVLKRVYEWKESYYEIYDAASKYEANEMMNQWLTDLPKDLHRPFKPARDALNNWRPWILNYWDHPYTNAYAESLNNLIGRMNMQGVGYSPETLRAKALLKHGVFGKTQWGEWVHIGREGSIPMMWDVGLGVPLSTLDADLEAGTF